MSGRVRLRTGRNFPRTRAVVGLVLLPPLLAFALTGSPAPR